ncbi:MAG: HlyD family efflux transporter periplasmic adaptor subunit [Planctomycetota bacterium]
MNWAPATTEAKDLPSRTAATTNASSEVGKSLSLIEAVAASKSQSESIEAIVGTLRKMFPEATIRCGVGSIRLSQLFDSKLGWLGPASSIFQQISEFWDDESQELNSSSSSSMQRFASGSEAMLRLNIDDADGSGRCILIVQGASVPETDRRWIRRCLPTLRLLLWHRPNNPLTKLARWNAARGINTRMYLGLGVFFACLMLICPVSYRVRCAAIVRPAESRVVAAPFAATLAETHVEPGDKISVGDAIVTLDGRPLRLELESINAQIGQIEKEHDIAMAARKIAERQQARLKIRELSRQRDLLLDRLDRLTVTSPIEGVVVFGDLKRSVGAPLEIGQSIAEIAPLDRMFIEIEIPEHEIGYVDAKARTRIRLTASHRGTIEKQIKQLYPSAELRDNNNVFIATVDVENPDGDLRPGMRGTAITYGPMRPWLWSYAHGGIEKLLWWIGY